MIFDRENRDPESATGSASVQRYSHNPAVLGPTMPLTAWRMSIVSGKSTFLFGRCTVSPSSRLRRAERSDAVLADAGAAEAREGEAFSQAVSVRTTNMSARAAEQGCTRGPAPRLSTSSKGGASSIGFITDGMIRGKCRNALPTNTASEPRCTSNHSQGRSSSPRAWGSLSAEECRYSG